MWTVTVKKPIYTPDSLEPKVVDDSGTYKDEMILAIVVDAIAAGYTDIRLVKENENV